MRKEPENKPERPIACHKPKVLEVVSLPAAESSYLSRVAAILDISMEMQAAIARLDLRPAPKEPALPVADGWSYEICFRLNEISQQLLRMEELARKLTDEALNARLPLAVSLE